MSMREVFHAKRVAPGENPGMDALDAVMEPLDPASMSYVESSRNSRWGEWRVSLVGSSTWWIEGQSGTKQYIVHVLPEHKARGVYVWRPDPFYPPRAIRPLPEKSGWKVLRALERDLHQFGSEKAEWPSAQDLFGEGTIYLALGERLREEREVYIWKEESILGDADPLSYWISLQGGAQQFYSRGLVILRMEQEQIPAWADEAVGYELREGELYVFPDGSCRFVPRRQDYGLPAEAPAWRQGDCLVYELCCWERHGEPVQDGTERLDRHQVSISGDLEMYRWITTGMEEAGASGLQVKGGSGKITITHPEHEELVIETGGASRCFGILLAPGTSRPFQRAAGD